MHILTPIAEETYSPVAYLSNLLVECIKLPPFIRVCIVDADPGTHHAWRTRLSKLDCRCEVVFYHFYRIVEFRKFMENRLPEENEIFLVDYDLGPNAETGIEVINKNNISGKSIVVTSKYNEESLIRDCVEHNIKVLPKTLISTIPILGEDFIQSLR